MLPVHEALDLVLKHTPRRQADVVALTSAALGLILAEDIASDIDQPPFDKALMDGYALRCADVAALPGGKSGSVAPGMAVTSAVLNVVEEIVAGRPPRQFIRSGQAARLMTGAMVPPGADVVVKLEDVHEMDGTRICVLETGFKPGHNILPRGKEMRAGERVLSAGTTLRPQELGLLASVGKNMVQAYRRPEVAILSTGDELVEPGVEPGQGQIRNSNATLLAALVARAGGQPNYLGIARDSVESLRTFVSEGLRADALLLTGGVSAGKLDLVPGVLDEFGVTRIFHKVAMKPGKPLLFGTKEDKVIFGLPGNPVSALVGFELFVRPALRAMMGHANPGPRFVSAQLTDDYQYASNRPTYHPALLHAADDGWRVTLVAWFGSPDLRSISQANAFAVLEAGDRHYQAGDTLKVLAPE